MKRNVYKVLSIIFFLIGIIMIYIIAETEDAPGLIIIGFSILGILSSLLFGLGQLIDISKENSKLLKEIINNRK
jgi:hypothetical protein